MKKTLISIGIVVALVAGFFLLNQHVYDQKQGDQLSEESVEAFQSELTTRGVVAVGQPIEGFDAFLLLSAFGGLEEADFSGVETREGVYRYEDGALTYERTADQPVTSAEQMVSTDGYATLLSNVSLRLDMPATNPAEVSSIVDVLEQGGAVNEGEPITISGQIACLPKIGDGPQTLECALGLEAEDGSYYSLQTPADVETNYQFLGTDTMVTVEGRLTDEEQYGPDGNRYDTVGTIVISEVREQ